MKKVIAVLALLCIGWAIISWILEPANVYNRQRKIESVQAEAKLSLTKLYALMMSERSQNNKFPLKLNKFNIENKLTRNRYKIFTAGMGDKITDFYCPSCRLSANYFKVLAYTNLDNDETLDIWTMDSNQVLEHLSDDSKD